jgi:AraC-like DNA-binding protein
MPKTAQKYASKVTERFTDTDLLVKLRVGKESEVFHRDLHYNGPIHFGIDSRRDAEFEVEGFGIYSSQGVLERIAPHRAAYYLIALHLSGEMLKIRGLERFRLVKNCLNFTAPGEINEYRTSSPDAEFIYVGFSEEFITAAVRYQQPLTHFPFFEYNNTQVFSLSDRDKDYIQSLFLAIDAEYHSHAWQRTTMIQLLLYQMLIYAKRCYDKTDHVVSAARQAEISLIRRFKAAIDTSYSRLVSVTELAEQLYVSPKYLSEVVKRELGCTPSEFIQHRVILYAKYLLCNTDMTVGEIAAALNFEDQSYFTRFFRKHVQQTPTEYRIAVTSGEFF